MVTMQKKVVLKTKSLSTFFDHLLTCKVKAETIPGFVLMSNNMKLKSPKLFWGPAGVLGDRAHLQIFKEKVFLDYLYPTIRYSTLFYCTQLSNLLDQLLKV